MLVKPVHKPFVLYLLLMTILITPLTISAQEVETTPEVTPEPAFEIGDELTIAALLELEIEGSEILFEEALEDGENYSRYIASYTSEGNKIYGLLTIPFGDIPEGGFKAVVFNHGYIPPSVYQTTERYVDYVDELAQAGLVVFKIDMRGHGNSEGEASGSYFSPYYTIDAISALKSLQQTDFVDPNGIGMWGHSMSGNLVLRAMLIEPDIQAGVIWAGAVYSYDDFAQYSITDTSYQAPATVTPARQRSRDIIATYGFPNLEVPYWQAVSLTENIEYLESPLQLHHALNDDVVDVGYSSGLVSVLQANDKPYEFYTYETGGHNIAAPSFELAMARTVAFFLRNL